MQLDPRISPLGGLGPDPSQAPPSPKGVRLAALQADARAALEAIDGTLGAAARRAAFIGGLRAGAAGLAALLTIALAAAAAASALSAGAGRLVGCVLLGLAGWGGFTWLRRSALQRWVWPGRDRHDRRALVRLLGGSSELLSSVELRAEPLLKGVSPELLDLLHVRAARQLPALEPARTLPLSCLRGPAFALLASAAALLIVAGRAPAFLTRGMHRLVELPRTPPPGERTPIVGDLSLTYLYPAYTGLPPRTEEGTAGELRGPRGTQVRLVGRADRDVTQAVAVLNGAAVRLESSGAGGRHLEGTLTLTQPGRWSVRFLDKRGRTAVEGPERPVEIIPDQPPQAALDAPTQRVLEVDPRGKVAISWSAQDDYGLTQVALVFQKAGGVEQRIALGGVTGASPARRLRGSFSWDVSGLELRAGEKVSYFVEARDNDAIDGPQRGVSATQVLQIFSASEHSKQSLLRAQALWERLVALLADRLEEKPAPELGPASTEDGAEAARTWFSATSNRDHLAGQLAVELAAAGRELSRDKLAPRALARALRYASAGLGPVTQRTRLAREPLGEGSGGGTRASEGRVTQSRLLARVLASEIQEEEKDVLYLEDLLDRARLDAMQEIGKELATSRRELARLADQLRRAPDEATRKQLLAEIDRVRERVQELMKRMSELAQGIHDEHLNREALESADKQGDLMSNLDDVQRKLQAGKIDEALKELDKLGKQLDELGKGLQESGEKAHGERYAEERRQLSEAAAQLKEVERKQEALEKKTAQIRRETQEAARRRFAQRGGPDLAKSLKEKIEQARRSIQQVEPKVAEKLGMEDALEAAQGRVADLKRALELGDFEEARELAERSLRAVQSLSERLTMEDSIGRHYPRFVADPEALRRSMQGAAGAEPPLAEAVRKLRDALPREGEGISAQQMQQLQAQRQEQKALEDQLEAVRQKLGEVGKKAPVFGPGHEKMLQDAQQGMGEASNRLGRGEPRGAQAGQAKALEKLRQFEKAMQERASQSQSGGGEGLPLPWGEPQGEGQEGDEGDNQSISQEKVQIPDAESSQAPAEFRKELMDAMKQQPPEKFKDRVKQYYEELVK